MSCSFEETKGEIAERKERENRLLLNRLEEIKSFKAEISNEPADEDIFKIISFLKEAELYSGRVTGEESLIKRYTWVHCWDIVVLILNAYNKNEDLKIVRHSSKIPLMYERVPNFHYTVKFHDAYYDINGRHTFNELKEYCEKEFKWQGIQSYEYSVSETDYLVSDDTVIKFCLSRINFINASKDDAELKLF